MQFSKKGNMYRIMRMTGNQDNILGVCFSKNDSDEIQVIEFRPMSDSKIETSQTEVLKQVISGLKSINQSLGTDYKLSKIYYLPSEKSTDRVYSLLIIKLILRYHNREEFKEI